MYLGELYHLYSTSTTLCPRTLASEKEQLPQKIHFNGAGLHSYTCL